VIFAMRGFWLLAAWSLREAAGADQSENCGIWAAAGECTRNAAYMLKAMGPWAAVPCAKKSIVGGFLGYRWIQYSWKTLENQWPPGFEMI